MVSPLDALGSLWAATPLGPEALQRIRLGGADPVLPSSFAIGTAAQVSLGAAALAATELGRLRNGMSQEVSVDMTAAAIECVGRFSVDGRTPDVWDPLAGLYRCSDGWLRLHTNFAHHRDGVLRLLGLPTGAGTERAAVDAAIASWRAFEFEREATDAGLVVAAVRTFDEWSAYPQQAAVATLPLVEIERIGAAPPLEWPSLPRPSRPLAGLRVLDLTRNLAGPVAGRTLAAYGADVMLVNSPRLPNIEAVADTSRGKRSAWADLHDADDRRAFEGVLGQAHAMLQSYRPGGLCELGFGAEDAARLRPGIVYTSLSAYGRRGPWAGKRGFDSLVQTATGFNADEADASGEAKPRAMPTQILDMASGFLLAFGTQAALARQRAEGGSWHVQVSLARTGQWLRELGRVDGGFGVGVPSAEARMETSDSGFGLLRAVRHAASFSATPAGYARKSVQPGTDPLSWSE